MFQILDLKKSNFVLATPDSKFYSQNKPSAPTSKTGEHYFQSLKSVNAM